jgi:hypothetical protein
VTPPPGGAGDRECRAAPVTDQVIELTPHRPAAQRESAEVLLEEGDLPRSASARALSPALLTACSVQQFRTLRPGRARPEASSP